MEDELRAYYEIVWKRLETILPKDQGVSLPFLISVPTEYESAEFRLAVVGQETHGWGLWGQSIDGNPVELVQRDYAREFREYGRGFFLPAARRLQELVSRDVPSVGLVWVNMFTCSQKRGRLNPDIAAAIAEVRVLANEINILKPDAVVFFTGPSYDTALGIIFPNVRPLPDDGSCGKWVRKLEAHDPLPQRSFRTYHPAYLNRRGVLDATLNRLAELIKEKS